MINPIMVDKLVNLIKQGFIVIEDIKVIEYKTEVQSRLTSS